MLPQSSDAQACLGFHFRIQRSAPGTGNAHILRSLRAFLSRQIQKPLDDFHRAIVHSRHCANIVNIYHRFVASATETNRRMTLLPTRGFGDSLGSAVDCAAHSARNFGAASESPLFFYAARTNPLDIESALCQLFTSKKLLIDLASHQVKDHYVIQPFETRPRVLRQPCICYVPRRRDVGHLGFRRRGPKRGRAGDSDRLPRHP